MKKVFYAILGITLIGGIIGVFTDPQPKSTSNPSKPLTSVELFNKRAEVAGFLIKSHLESNLKSYLKNPKSYDHEGWPKVTYIEGDSSTFTVRGEFYAQNGFGANLLNRYFGKVTFPDSTSHEKYKLLEFEILK